MSTDLDMPEDAKAALMDMLAEHLSGIEIWAYGSRVNGTSHPSSDLDLVAFVQPSNDPRLGAFREALEESSLPMRVEVQVWDDLPSNFQQEIERSAIRLT